MTVFSGSHPLRGFMLALAAGVVFQCLNVSVKQLVHELPAMQVAWMRWIAGLLCIGPFMLMRGSAPLNTGAVRLHGLRAVLHASGYALWYSAVGLIPLATTAALGFTGFSQVFALQPHRARSWLIKPAEQMQQRALARTTGADNGHRLTSADF